MPKYRYYNNQGYVRVKAPNHPIAEPSSGNILEHRYVKYEEMGDGPHPCHWCEEMLYWDKIAVDHLNELKDDNRPENLVISCGTCNRMRGAMLPTGSLRTRMDLLGTASEGHQW